MNREQAQHVMGQCVSLDGEPLSLGRFDVCYCGIMDDWLICRSGSETILARARTAIELMRAMDQLTMGRTS